MNFLLPPLEPHFEAALRDVRAQGAQAREAAALRLGRPEPGRVGEAREGLRQLLDDAYPQIRAAALRSLEDVGDASTFEAVRARLDDTDAAVRELAVIALATTDHPHREMALHAALRHPAPEVRFQAVAALSEATPGTQAEDAGGDAEAPARLTWLLGASHDEDARVRECAARALGQGIEKHEHVDSAPTTERAESRARTRLHALLQDAAPGVRFEAAFALAGSADPAALPLLEAALAMPSLRLDALEALGHYPSEQAGTAVTAVQAWGIRVLAPPHVNAIAGRTLLRMGRPELASACLREALTAWRSDGRNLALTAIAEADPAQRETLSELGSVLQRLAQRPRGADLATLVAAASNLAATSQAALASLRKLASLEGPTGDAARNALATPP